MRLISHSVAPEVDSISLLSAYARANGIRSGKWHLVTGPFGEIQSLARLGYFVDLDDQTGYDREVIHTETLAFSPSSGGLPATDPRVRRALPWRRPPPPGRPLR